MIMARFELDGSRIPSPPSRLSPCPRSSRYRLPSRYRRSPLGPRRLSTSCSRQHSLGVTFLSANASPSVACPSADVATTIAIAKIQNQAPSRPLRRNLQHRFARSSDSARFQISTRKWEASVYRTRSTCSNKEFVRVSRSRLIRNARLEVFPWLN